MSWLDEQPVEVVEPALAKLRETEPGYIAEMADGDERFGLWLKLIDTRMVRTIGFTHRDISDWTWRDAFDGGTSPGEAMREAIAADDTFGGLL